MDWYPEKCLTCNGANRVEAPNCGCKAGFTDFYKNAY